jgi:hypothetical protein
MRDAAPVDANRRVTASLAVSRLQIEMPGASHPPGAALRCAGSFAQPKYNAAACSRNPLEIDYDININFNVLSME